MRSAESRATEYHQTPPYMKLAAHREKQTRHSPSRAGPTQIVFPQRGREQGFGSKVHRVRVLRLRLLPITIVERDSVSICRVQRSPLHLPLLQTSFDPGTDACRRCAGAVGLRSCSALQPATSELKTECSAEVNSNRGRQ